MRAYCAVFFVQCIFINFCLGELSSEKKEQVLNGFIDSLNNLPDQLYTYEEGVLLDAQKTGDDTYKVTARLKVSEIHNIDVVKILKCKGDLSENQDKELVVQPGHECVEDQGVGDIGDDLDANMTETTVALEGPVKLDNEVQSDAEVISGEQFVAIPRASPIAPCIGCASHVDPTAAGVSELANLGIRHLDLHDTGAKHALRSVVDVERQVQVVNGVRYILTMLVDYDNCTAPDAEPCPVSTPCKISILEKPWKKLPDGSKYRAILANNCTTEWLFGDEGEVIPVSENNENNEIHPNPADPDALKVVHNFDVGASPNQEKENSDAVLKNIEDQIIPLNEFETPGRHEATTERTAQSLETIEQINVNQKLHYNENAATGQLSPVTETSLLTEDKKKAIDDIMHYFDLDGVQKPDLTGDHQRERRSYDVDLKVSKLARHIQKVNKIINNANYMQKLARAMVDYLNKVDMVIQSRVLTDVLLAEEESGNNQHFFYLQASVTIPCEKAKCTPKDDVKEICNGVIEITDESSPRILNAFCYGDEADNNFNKEEIISVDDPILVELVQHALEKIESESIKDNAMKLIKILDATTKKVSGTLTKITMSLKYTNCKKSQNIYNRVNCSTIEDMGTTICEVEIHEIHKSMQITYSCTEKSKLPSGVRFSDLEKTKKNTGDVDPGIRNMLEEAIKKLRIQSDRTEKMKVFNIKSVTTQLVAGLLTKIAFTAGYTNCTNDKFVDLNNCKFLQNEAIRDCEAHVWDRPWLTDSRQINVKCKSEHNKPSDIESNEISASRKKRSYVGGQTTTDPDDPEYNLLAQESLDKYRTTIPGGVLNVKELKVTKVTKQVVSGTITRIDFTVFPANGEAFTCHSKIWEQAWLKKKEIDVNCNENKEQGRAKRQIAGGLTEQSPDDPEYKQLAQESLDKYRATIPGGVLNVKELKVTKVTKQVVSGTITRIDFTVFPANGEAFTCHSKIWEQAWLKKKEIDVNCNENKEQGRAKRQIAGGETEQSPDDPEYKQLAQESLDKYRATIPGGLLNVKELKVTKVTTQVVTGTLTRIDFTVYLTNAEKLICHSKVWEDQVIKKKDIDVNCNQNKEQKRAKRQIPGGQTEQSPNDPKYIQLAQESLDKYRATTPGGLLNVKELKVTKVTKQVVSGTMTRIDFTVFPANGEAFTCHSKIWEQPWLNKKEIDVNCNENREQGRAKRQIAGGLTEQSPDDPEYKQLAQESLNKYRTTIPGGVLNVKKLKVTKVTKQVVSGTITRIDFTVFPANGEAFTCHSKIWEQPWLKKKEIDVNCNENKEQGRAKRQIAGGQTEQSPDDPEYKQLAQESLDKYRTTIPGGVLNVKELKVTKVTKQVVSGTITRIDFTVFPANGEAFTCHSKIWEQPWLKKKEIGVNCNENKEQGRAKRQIFGGQTEQSPDDPKYKQLAQESLDKYRTTIPGGVLNVKELKVTKVTKQVVSGTITRIDFTVFPANGEAFTCHSKIWEQPWLKKKEIDVNCNENKEQGRAKRQIAGGQTEQSPDDPEYKQLAQESLDKYRTTIPGGVLNVKELKVTKVTKQVVSGTITRIDFTVFPANGEAFTCHSKIWEQPWLKKKEIDVNCNENKEQGRAKRQIFGGQTEQSPDDPKYKQLAQESLDKYRTTIPGGVLNVKELKVTKVTKQVVSGTITRIDFTVFPANGETFTCHSKIWEQPWLKKKEIDVNCNENKEQGRAKRQIAGGQTEQSPDDPEYKQLAQESLDKYRTTIPGGVLNVKELKVTKVTKQVVSGTITRIDFTVFPANGEAFTCHSKIWEQPWLKKKEIDVNCNENKEQGRAKRQIAGGETEQSPDDPKYKQLAQESLDKYRTTLVGGQLNVKEFKVTKVTTKVVSGSMTHIDFTVYPTNGDEIKCHSEIWEQPWLKKKDINVNCGLNNQESRKKRAIFSGNPTKYKFRSFHKEDASKPEFKLLAMESLRKYTQMRNSPNHHEVVEVRDVVSQVVEGKLYEIEFTAVPTSCALNEVNPVNCIAQNDTLLICHSQVWSRPWLKSNEIDVICNFDKKNDEYVRLEKENVENINRDIVHPEQETKGKDLYPLAREVLHKYERQSNSEYKYKIRSIGKSYEQISDGILTTIEFYVSPTICPILDESDVENCQLKKPEVTLLCKSIIRERTWILFKDIQVVCTDVRKTKVESSSWDDETPGVHVNYVGREKRDIVRDDDDNYMDDEMRFYYANRAMQHLNQHGDSLNLQKLITIHSLDASNQMGARMIRMYIETASTFCVRHQLERVDLSQCDEMDGLPHKLCHVRLWPSINDEMIIRHVVVVCDDDKDFASVTGFEVSKLISASLRKLEESPNVKYKLVHQGEPYVMPSLSSRFPIKMNFVVLRTNCTKDIDVFKHRDKCFIDSTTPAASCESQIYLSPNSKDIKDIQAWCSDSRRQRRNVNFSPAKTTTDDVIIAQLVDESLEKLEISSLHRYKQRVLKINSYSTKITRGRETTIDFDVGYSSCLKYESIRNISNCEFVEHLPIRHCISHVSERLWVENGRNIEVVCEDDETPLESQMEFDNANTANKLANEALKHIEAKYPNPKRLQVVRIFSLQKQAIAGLHYKLKMEVGVTDCPALSLKSDCKLVDGFENNKFCRVNVWVRPWTDHPPNFRVTCDYQESETAEVYHRMQAEHLFANFIATYRPDYMDDYKEMARRFKIFRANVRKVHEMNIHERGTATYAITRFSDLTQEEFTKKYLGLNVGLRNENDIPMIKAEIPNVDLPQSFDWREHGAVTEVKNQGSCGSCWAFSVTGNVEGQWKLQTGKLLSLSEQELVDCDKKDQGCNGGLMDNAYRAIEELGGLELETDYPYEGEDDKCVFNKTLSKVQISGAVNISSNETEMAQWLVSNGPISIGINANAMQFYVGGISHPWKALCSPKNLDHGVLIVGFGIKEYPLFNKHLPYWTVKNSWGKSWGEQGYYRVYRGDGTCGVNKMASSAVV